MIARGHRSGRLTQPSRRTFVKGLAIGGAAASIGLLRQPVVGADAPAAGAGGAVRHRVRPAHRRDRGQRHRQVAHGAHDQRLAAGAAAALAGGRHGHAERRERPRRGHVDSLARHPAARQHGRRARPQLLGHPSGPGVSLPLHGEAARHLLVPQPLGLPGAAGRLRPARDRAARARARSSSTASTS